MIVKALTWFVGAVAILLCAVTLVSLVPSNRWWIAVLNFPRLLMLIVISLMTLGVLILSRRWRYPLLIALALAAVLQLWRIYPYVFFAPAEVVEAGTLPRRADASCFKTLGLNVYQHNRDYAATRSMIEREQPDILLLMETDAAWARAMQAVLARYPHRVMRPLDNTYGLIFASKLPVRSAHTENVTDHDTPTVYADLVTRDEQAFHYIGLHPRPPSPGQDTGTRDRKIARAALRIAGDQVPAVAMGDFNDVPWSRTTQVFKQVGGYLDPRIGRGDYPTFPADYAPVGWPLDQIFVSPAFTFRSLRVLQNVGSDHRPLAAVLCLAPSAARAANARPEKLDATARAAARGMTGTAQQ